MTDRKAVVTKSSASVDVVIVGSGVAGLATAVAAAMHGLRSIVLECAEKIGGATACSFGGIWVPNSREAQAMGIADSEELATEYMTYVGGGQTTPGRVAAFIGNAPRMMQCYQSAGIPFRLQRGVNDHFSGITSSSLPEGRNFEIAAFAGASLGPWRDRLVTPEGEFWRVPLQKALSSPPSELAAAIGVARECDEISQGPGLIAHLLKVALERGVTVLTGVRIRELVRDQGRISGVRTSDGSEFNASTGVVLATGGFESDVALVDAIENLPGYRSAYPKSLLGDGLRMGGQVGGAIKIVHNNAAILLAYQDPKTQTVEVVANTNLVCPHTLVVNRFGQRFGNEGTFQELAPALRRYDPKARSHMNLPCWMVFDHQFVEGHGLGRGGPGAVPDWVVRGGTVAELASQIGIDAEKLVATVDRFNQFAADGVDTDFGRGDRVWKLFKPGAVAGNPSLGALREPPYYAVPLHPTIINASGLATDPWGRVVDWHQNGIPGLFAIGNVAAHDEYGVGYQSGQSISSAMTFALLAVEAMVGVNVAETC